MRRRRFKSRKRRRGGFKRRRVRVSRTSDGMRFRGRGSGGSRRKLRKSRRRTFSQLKSVEPDITTLESGGVASSVTGRCSYSVVLAPKSGYDLNTLAVTTQNFPPMLQQGADKIFIKCWARTEIINQSLLPTNITFYTCKPRYNITRAMFSPISTAMADLGAWTGGNTGGCEPQQVARPNTSADYGTNPSVLGNAFSTLGYNLAAGSAYAGLHQIPSLTPFDAPLFTRLFKITSVRQSCVNPGKCFTLSSSRPYARWDPLTMNVRGDQLSGAIAYKGEPIVVMKLQGGPVCDTSVHTNTTIAPTRVSYVCQRKYFHKIIENNRRSITSTITLPTGFGVNGHPEYVTCPSSQVQTGAVMS